MRLSTRALKADSLDQDPRSGFNVVSRELHTAHDYGHCTAGLSAWHAAQIRIEAVWGQSGLWIRIPDSHRIRI